MTARIDGSPYQHGDLVTVADIELVVAHHDRENHLVEVVPLNNDCGFTVHESQVSSR